MYMKRCLELATNGLGSVAPNPMVGAVIVYKDKIIGEGFHEHFGEAHAEVRAVEDALQNNSASLLSQSTLYVSLEPCSHTGKTPPCTQLIINKQFKRVVIACEDPFEKVQGRGIKLLREAGLEITFPVLEKEAIYLNRRFMTHHKKKRPFVILKYAQSADHFISALIPSEEERWISNIYSRKLVHRWRSEEQAVMVGTHTARVDDPALTLRDWPGNQPLRAVLDRKLSLPPQLKLFDRSVPTLVFNELKDEKEENLEYIRLDFTLRLIPQILHQFYQRSIQSIIIEGGQKLLQSFIDENAWDEARIFSTEKVLKNGLSAPVFKGHLISSHRIANDLLKIYDPL